MRVPVRLRHVVVRVPFVANAPSKAHERASSDRKSEQQTSNDIFRLLHRTFADFIGLLGAFEHRKIVIDSPAQRGERLFRFGPIYYFVSRIQVLTCIAIVIRAHHEIDLLWI